MCKKLGKDLLKKIYIFQLIKKITDYINTEVNYFTELSGRSSGVEHNLAKVRVEGSNPFARSSFLSFITLSDTTAFLFPYRYPSDIGCINTISLGFTFPDS